MTLPRAGGHPVFYGFDARKIPVSAARTRLNTLHGEWRTREACREWKCTVKRAEAISRFKACTLRGEIHSFTTRFPAIAGMLIGSLSIPQFLFNGLANNHFG